MSPAGFLAAAAVAGLWGTSADAADLRPEDVKSHIGETATVCGVVASAMFETNVQGQPTLLDLGEPSPHAIFTAVIYGDNRPKGSALSSGNAVWIPAVPWCHQRWLIDAHGYSGPPTTLTGDADQLALRLNVK